MATGYLLSLCALGLLAAADESWSSCPAICRCKWNSGRKTAGCANSSLTAVPANLSREIQSLDLSHNSLASLPADALRSVSLVNLHKLFLRACGMRAVHRDAFAGLEILIELDLSWNSIRALHPDTFRDNVRLRVVYVNHNPLRELPDGIFNGLAFLQTVDAGDCELGLVGERAFVDVPNLRDLKLNNNNLTTVRLAAVQRVHSLVSLVLFGNPWRCNCDLKLFIDWAISRNLYTPPTMCREPPSLRGRLWSELAPEDLACRPRISVPTPVLEAAEGNATLRCRASGSPAPEMHWVFRSRVVANSSKWQLLRRSVGAAWWLNLTIAELDARDAGDYTCVARGPGGAEERRVVLKVLEGPERRAGARAEGYSTEALSLIAGLVAGGLLLLVAGAVCVSCLLCRKDLRAREPRAACCEGAAPADKQPSASSPAPKAESAFTTEMTRFLNNGPCQCSGAELVAAPRGRQLAADRRALPPDLLPHPSWTARRPAWGSVGRLSAYDNLGPRATVDGSAAPAERTPGWAHAGSQTCQSTLGVSTCQSTLGISTCQSTLGISTFQTHGEISTYQSTLGMSTCQAPGGLPTCQSTLGMSTCQAPGGLPTCQSTLGMSTCQAPRGLPTCQSILGISTCQAHGEISTCQSTQGISTCQAHGEISTCQSTQGISTCQAHGEISTCQSTQGISTCQAHGEISTCQSTQGISTCQAPGGLPTCQSILGISTCQAHGEISTCQSTQGISTCQAHGGLPTSQASGRLPTCQSILRTSTCQPACRVHGAPLLDQAPGQDLQVCVS